MRAFSDASLSTPVYVVYLSLQLQLHAPLEASLVRWLPPACSDLRLRKSEWLRRDLRAMGARPAEPAVAAAAGVESQAQALGVLYVLEGSTLGLQVVRKQLQDMHPALLDAGRFMLGYGHDTGRRWRDLLVQLEELAPPDWPLAEEAASATFDSFLRAFSKVDVASDRDFERT
jgi:heme oxygenase